jgi:hypothetical protein
MACKTVLCGRCPFKNLDVSELEDIVRYSSSEESVIVKRFLDRLKNDINCPQKTKQS